MDLTNRVIAVVGLGYVGLPLAIEYGKKYRVIGFDIFEPRVAELQAGKDHTLEADLVGMKQARDLYETTKKVGLTLTSDISELKQVNTYIVTVPTPIDRFNTPDLKPLLSASELIGKTLNRGDIVIYESTVYPGCTEEDCVPVLEKFSGLKFNQDFYCGYSPERINPGDKVNTLTKIKKITSGSTPEVADIVDALYNSILENGTHRAPNMKVAEAAKAVENSQRDVNISFMNELALICDRVGIDTNELPEVPSGTRRRALHIRGPVLSRSQSQSSGLRAAGYTVRTCGEQLHREVHCRQDAQTHDSEGPQDQGLERTDSGCDLQGELPRLPKHQGGGHCYRVGGFWLPRGYLRPVGFARGCSSRVRQGTDSSR